MQLCSFIRAAVVAALAAFYAETLQANQQEMRTIEDFILKQGDNSKAQKPATIMFYGLRCSSLYLILSQFSDDNKHMTDAKKFKAASEAAFEMAYEERGNTSDEFITKQMEYMVKAYVERMQKSKAMTGNALSDAVVAKDLKTCGLLFKK